MNQERSRSNDYEQNSEPVEVFGYRRFESEQDFPHPPPSTQTKNQPTLDFFQPHETEDWIDGFLESQPDHDAFFGELPGTFVGITTTLSPSERNQVLEEPRIFGDGLDPFSFRGSGSIPQVPKLPFNYSYNFSHDEDAQNNSARRSLGTHQTFESLYSTSTSAYENMPMMTQDGNYYFPTPPLPTHVPNMFDQNGDFGGRMPNPRIVPTPRRLQFGSDARFEGPGFMPPPEQETEEALVRRKINHLECLKPEASPASTHPPSPVVQKRKHDQIQHLNNHVDPRYQPHPQQPGPSQAPRDHEDTDLAPKRRRKAAIDDDPDFEYRSTARTNSKRSKASSAMSHTPVKQESATACLGNGTRVRQGSVKNNRQTLSDEQKKTNHIISEQKRRDLIRRGYEGIQVLVPALKGTKVSKGNMLESAADWLDDILDCNEQLRQQLVDMKRGPGRYGLL